MTRPPPQHPTTSPPPPSHLNPAEREAFAALARLAGAPLDGWGVFRVTRIAQLVARAGRAVEAGKLADAVALGDLARELAGRYAVTLPASLLPAIGRA